ncbi:peptidase [Salmonella enterica subsp. enterica serovar Telelkebir]|nr:peptidase [Salmonella enterica subsp. enterica serovar Telelkebir]ECC3295645.1 peptidase [Salmonella enterica subsp. enterica]EDR2888300.1 peptidase [Salmonella enterica subsp. enterica]EDR6140821.1 peptidase [Salmonella enterica subsp. enterica]EDU9860143.1 peptidase [Salmonella enterica subsp. enterica]
MKTELMALCFALPELKDDQPLPEWLPVIPAGQFTGRDGRSWVNTDPAAVIAASFSHPSLPFDIEHSTELKGPKGEPAPAFGWIEQMRVNADGSIDARVIWTPEGEALLRAKKYRFYSPAFGYTAAGRVTRLSSAALTNKPNLDFPALNSEMSMTLPLQIATALGLAAAASVDDAVTAITQIKNNEQVALNRATSPDPTKFIPAETHQLALNRAETAETRLKKIDDDAAEALVDGAIAVGKVAPANREMYLALCRTETGRTQFAEFAKGAPVLVNNDKPQGGKPAGGDEVTLTEADVALCHSMGITKDEFIAERKKEGAR